MHWIYLIHEFHNLSWITEINELFHDIIIYWDAPVSIISIQCKTKVKGRTDSTIGSNQILSNVVLYCFSWISWFIQKCITSYFWSKIACECFICWLLFHLFCNLKKLMFASKHMNPNYFWVLAPDKLYIIRMLCVSQWLCMFLLNPRRVRESAIVWIGAAYFIILNQALSKHAEQRWRPRAMCCVQKQACAPDLSKPFGSRASESLCTLLWVLSSIKSSAKGSFKCKRNGCLIVTSKASETLGSLPSVARHDIHT